MLLASKALCLPMPPEQCHPRQHAWLVGFTLPCRACVYADNRHTVHMYVLWPPERGLACQRLRSHLV